MYKYNIVNVVLKHHKHILLLKIPNLNADGNFTLPIYRTVHFETLVTMIDIFFCKYSEYRLSVISSYKGGPIRMSWCCTLLIYNIKASPSVNVISSTYFSSIYLYHLEKKNRKKNNKNFAVYTLLHANYKNIDSNSGKCLIQYYYNSDIH